MTTTALSRREGLPRRALGAALDAVFDPAGILKAEQSLYEIPTTSLTIVRNGMVAYTYGDVTQPPISPPPARACSRCSMASLSPRV